ncbi:MAG: bifunctional enoyl-CoA hydratase/phosphate acetyltransferase [Gammaproteobacteria bacterium]|jgi:phosphotransacetylase/acyl dehydratase
MQYIQNHTFDEINIGDSAVLTRILTEKDIELFAIMSGDINPAHLDKEYVKTDIFQKIVAHGMWGGALISTVLGTQLPGPGTIYLGQTLKFLHPISVGDKVTVSVTVAKKHTGKPIIDLDCRCVLQNEMVAVTGVATVMAPTEKVKRERMVLPDMILKEHKNSLYDYLTSLNKNFTPIKTAIVHPVDRISLEGAIVGAEEGLIIPILIGPKAKILSVAKESNLDISSYTIIDTKHSHEAAELSVAMARKGEVEALMKGNIHTDELMEMVVDKKAGLRTARRITHVFVVDTQNYPKPLFITDAAINIHPTLLDKVDIVQNAISLFKALQLGTPKVAIVSAVETVTEKIPSTLDATALCKMADRGQIIGGILDGPLAFDSAISIQSAKVKGIESKVAGDADIIVVPDIESGNMLYKQMTYSSGMEAAGLVLGSSVPIILTSRGSDIESRKVSCAMALMYMRNRDITA